MTPPALPATNQGKVHLAASMHGVADATLASAAQATALAQNVDFIVGKKAKYNNFEPTMISANPDIVLGLYFVGNAVNQGSNFPAFPDDWVAHVSSGTGTAHWESGGHNTEWVMNPLVSGVGSFGGQNTWPKYHAIVDIQAALGTTYNLAYLDNMSRFDFDSGATNGPPNQYPAYTTPYSWTTWKGGLMSLADTISSNNTGAVIEANILDSGNAFYSNFSVSDLSGHLTLCQAEGWLRNENDLITAYPTDSNWQQSTQMVVDLNAANINVHARLGVNPATTPTQAQNDAWRVYGLASGFLCDRGGFWLDPRLDLQDYQEVANPMYQISLGAPLEAPATITHITGSTPISVNGGSTKTYARRFTNGAVIVTTDDSTSRTVTLDHADYKDAVTGIPIGGSTLTVQPSTGYVLQRGASSVNLQASQSVSSPTSTSISTTVHTSAATITIDTSRPVHGIDCVRVAASADGQIHYLQRTGLSSNQIVSRFFLNLASAPSVNRFYIAGCTNGPFWGVTNTLHPTASIAGTTQDGTFTFQPNTWYRIDLKFDTSLANWKVDYTISTADGGTLYSPTTFTQASTASPRTDFKWGELTDGALTFYGDDIKVQNAGYPIGWSGAPPNGSTPPLIDTAWEAATVTGDGVTVTVGSPTLSTTVFAHGKQSVQVPTGSSVGNTSLNSNVLVGRVFFQLDTLPNGDMDLIHAHMSGGGNADITIKSNGKFVVGAAGPSGTYTVSTASTLVVSTNTWYLLDYSFDATDPANVTIQYQVSSLALAILQASSSFTAPVGTTSPFSQTLATVAAGIITPTITNTINAYFDDWRVQTSGYPIGYQPTGTNFFQTVTATNAPLASRGQTNIVSNQTVIEQALTDFGFRNSIQVAVNTTLSLVEASTTSIAEALHTAAHNFTRALSTTASSIASTARNITPGHVMTAATTVIPSMIVPTRARQALTVTAASTTSLVKNAKKKLSTAAPTLVGQTLSKPVTLLVTLVSSQYSGQLGQAQPGAFELGSTGQGGIIATIQTAVSLRLRAAVALTTSTAASASTLKAAARTITTALGTSVASMVETKITPVAQALTATASSIATTATRKSVGVALTIAEATSITVQNAVAKTIRISQQTIARTGMSYAKTLLYQTTNQIYTNTATAITLIATTPGYAITIGKNITEAISAKIRTRLRGKHKKHTDHGDAETTSDDTGTPQ